MTSKNSSRQIAELLSDAYDNLERANNIANEAGIQLSVTIELNNGALRVSNEFSNQSKIDDDWESSSSNC